MAKDAAHIVLARMSSERLPGKALLPLGDYALLGLTIARLRETKQVDRIILATSDSARDDPLIDFAVDQGIEYFRGSLRDVSGRCLACATQFRLNWFVRICGDSPFIDPAVVDLVCEKYLEDRPDVATNVHPRTFPIGCSAEAVETAALRRLCATTKDLRYREHVTAFFYEHEEMFSIENVGYPDNRFEGVSIAVDTPSDYERAQWVYKHLSDPVTAPVEEIVETSMRWGGKDDKKVI